MERRGVEAAVRSTLDRRVDLPSGGYLIFDYAEAFTVIDVNTGRFVGARGKSAARGSRTRSRRTTSRRSRRSCGSSVCATSAGSSSSTSSTWRTRRTASSVEDALKRELEKDRTKTYVVEISPLGLVEMTRQNVTDGPREILTEACPICTGDGIVVSDETHAVEIERRLRRLAASSPSRPFWSSCTSQVAGAAHRPGRRPARRDRERDRAAFFFEAQDDVAADHFAVLGGGPVCEDRAEGAAGAAGRGARARARGGALRHPERRDRPARTAT